jgi:hypothetical protein
MKRYFIIILLTQAQVASYSQKTTTINDPCAAAMAITVKGKWIKSYDPGASNIAAYKLIDI